jgi:maleylpyruvate isomerase
MIKLYDYWRSSAAYRVRIALNLKGLDYTSLPINLAQGAQSAESYIAVNPQGLVPMLVDDDFSAAQSMAIIEYLDERYPEPAMLPSTSQARAHVRAMANIIACDIHPINNLRILKYLKNTLGADDDAIGDWYRHWIGLGFQALEKMVAGPDFSFGELPTLADICLVPQMANARRYNTDLAPFPKLMKIDQGLRALPAFAKAAPENQPDAS